ncbi:MAG: CynX/NimT family MFS transporter, partial [Vulcanimicrobiaceae bacterium]
MRYWFHLALLWLVGMDLRFTLLAVPPVLPQIHHDLALDEKAVGALTAMPVLLFSVAAIGGSILIARLGARRAVIVGLLVVAIAGAVRGVGPSEAMVFAMTFLMGAGVAVCQPAAPTLVGQWFPQRIGFATAVYVNGILLGEAIPADSVPIILPHIGGSWEWSLALWSIPVLLTAVVFWLAVSNETLESAAPSAAWWPDWHKLLTWRLGMLLAGISVLYFALNAYIPDYFHAVGRPWLAPIAIAALNSSQIPGSLVTLFFARKLTANPRYFFAILLFAAPAIVMLIAGSDAVVIAGVALLGVSSAVG